MPTANLQSTSLYIDMLNTKGEVIKGAKVTLQADGGDEQSLRGSE